MDFFIKSVVTIFFILGVIDYFLNNYFGIGDKFLKGISSMGALAIGIVGIYSISPYISVVTTKVFTPLCQLTGIDISIFSSLFLGVDIGGYVVASKIATNEAIGKFSGIIVASSFGSTLGFTLPVALGLIKNEDVTIFMKGFIIGLITLPIGTFIGGIIQGLPIGLLFLNNLPLLFVSFIICILFILLRKTLFLFFILLQKALILIGIFGLILQALSSFWDYSPLKEIIPISDSFLIVVKIALFLGGIYPFIHLIEVIFMKQFYILSKKLEISQISIISLLGNLVSNLVIFGMFSEMNEKGKVVCSALAVGLAFVIGGQFAYISAVESDMIIPFVASKVTSGFICILVLIFIYRKPKVLD